MAVFTAVSQDAAGELLRALNLGELRELKGIAAGKGSPVLHDGLGLLLVAWGAWRYRLLPRWSSAWAGIVGLTAMALTMGLPDHLSYYRPVFYALVAWLIATGVVLWRLGLRLDDREQPSPVKS